MNVFDDLLNCRCGGESPKGVLRAHPVGFSGDGAGSLHAFLCEQAHCLLELTMAAEVEEFLARNATLTGTDGKPAVVRNGYQPERDFLTHLGPIPLRIPKVRSRIDRPVAFRSVLVRPYLRRSRGDCSGAPWRFLAALSCNDLPAAMLALMGPEAAALPGAVMARVARRWTMERSTCLSGSLAELNYDSLWIESLRVNDHPPGHVEALMIAVGIDEPARRRLLTVADGIRESAQNWVGRLAQLHERGLPPPPRLRLGPGVSPAVAEAVARVYPRIAQAS